MNLENCQAKQQACSSWKLNKPTIIKKPTHRCF